MADEEKGEKKSKKGDDDGGGAGGDLKALIEALKGAGLNIPDEVEDIAGLIIAVKASGGESGGGSDDGLGSEQAGGATGAEEASPPVMMSLDVLAKKVVSGERKALLARIKALPSGVNKKLREQLLAEARTVRLSLDGRGDLKPNRLLAKVEAYEQLGPSPFLSRQAAQLGLGELEEDDVPSGRPDSPEATEKALEAWEQTVGRR